jgi:hypothetical protein
VRIPRATRFFLSISVDTRPVALYSDYTMTHPNKTPRTVRITGCSDERATLARRADGAGHKVLDTGTRLAVKSMRTVRGPFGERTVVVATYKRVRYELDYGTQCV